jgi:hypothetical protein
MIDFPSFLLKTLNPPHKVAQKQSLYMQIWASFKFGSARII